MSRRKDAVSPRKYKKDGVEKTYWVKVGTFWEGDDGKQSLTLDAYPLPGPDGKAVIHFFEPNDKGTSRPAKQTAAASNDMDDEIPF